MTIYQLEQWVARLKLEQARIKAEIRYAENKLAIAIVRDKNEQ